jgi:hypothetical protein
MHAKCSHNKRRNTCRKCKGSQQCPHNDYANRKANCPACRAIRNGLKLTRSHIPLGTSLKRKRHQSKVPPSIERTSKNTGTSDEKKERANKRKRNTYHARQLKRLLIPEGEEKRPTSKRGEGGPGNRPVVRHVRDQPAFQKLWGLISRLNGKSHYFSADKKFRNKHKDEWGAWNDPTLVAFLREIRSLCPERKSHRIASISVMRHCPAGTAPTSTRRTNNNKEEGRGHIDQKHVGNEFDVIAVRGASYRLRLFAPKGSKETIEPLEVQSGDMYTLSGVYRWEWKHDPEYMTEKWAIRIGYY